MGAIIGSAMSAAMQNCGDLPEPLAEGVLRNIFSLAALATGPSEEGRDAGRIAWRAQQLEAAKRHIEQRLGDPALSPASVAAALRLSPRTLHALFEPMEDSFARYVLQRRLARCHAALTGRGASRLGIADLAFACGFNSLATFNRAFLRRYGRAPSDAPDRGAGRRIVVALSKFFLHGMRSRVARAEETGAPTSSTLGATSASNLMGKADVGGGRAAGPQGEVRFAGRPPCRRRVRGSRPCDGLTSDAGFASATPAGDIKRNGSNRTPVSRLTRMILASPGGSDPANCSLWSEADEGLRLVQRRA